MDNRACLCRCFLGSLFMNLLGNGVHLLVVVELGFRNVVLDGLELGEDDKD